MKPMTELLLTIVSIPISITSLALILLYPIYGITLAIAFTCLVNVILRREDERE